jgi:hypothetical protein
MHPSHEQPRPDPRPLLRLEVGRLRQRESRRVFDASVNVGRLGGPRDSFVVRAQDAPIVDRGLRVEVVSCLLDELAPEDQHGAEAAAWLVRPGAPEPQDADLEWLGAASFAFAAHGARLTGFYAITRSGWLDLRGGETRVWKRLRL